MNRRDISADFVRFLRLQAICVAVIVASWFIWWAVGNPVGSVGDLFLYVFTQVNLTVILLHPLKFLYEDRDVRYHWPIHVIAILAVNCVIVVASATVIYRVHGMNFSFIEFLQQSWKFPFVANLVFAFAYESYKVTTSRLKRHNRKLQQAVDIDAAERQAEAEELEQAREIQRGFMPRAIPQLPDFAIAGAWQPAQVVGGDYFDVIRLSKDKVAVCIADVAGKGISAALLMANVQAAVRAFASEYSPPSKVCSQINSVLYTNTAPEKFVTLFYGVLDARTCTLQYTNAGHPRPLLMHRSGATTRLDNGGALLGVFPDWTFEDSVVELEPGDLLLLFTDGITEATDSSGEEFGEDRVIAALDAEHDCSLDKLQAGLLAHVRTFCNSQFNDDATLLMVAATGLPREKRPALLRDKRVDEVINYAGALS